MSTPPLTPTLDFALIVRLLKDVHKVPAKIVVHHSGGHTHEIHAGSVENGSTYPVICGPGWFNGTDFAIFRKGQPTKYPTMGLFPMHIIRIADPDPNHITLISPDATEETIAQLIANMSKGNS